MAQLSAQELAELYPSDEDRERILRLCSLQAFLLNCVIDGSYHVPDGMHTPIVLTKYGDRIAERLRKGGTPFAESRFLCFLEMLGPQPLVDVSRTDIDALQRSIHGQIRNGDLRLPYKFGRTLYDKFNNSYHEKKGSLSPKETGEFLHGTPQGVFQVDEYVSGPYGFLKSASPRFIGPTLLLPLQLCTDQSCSDVHKVALSTSQDAPVNEHRSSISRMLERDGLSIYAWFSFFDSFSHRYSQSTETNGEPVVTLIGDALTHQEMGKLLAWLFDNTKGLLRGTAQAVGLSGSSASIVSQLNPAQMLQLICTVENDFLVSALDTLVHNGTVNVPDGETRTAVINAEKSYGPYRLVAELNRLGVRLQSSRSVIAPLRMRKLVEKMYNLEDEADRQELLWQLRVRSGESVDRRLQRHLQSEDPREIIEKLALARRSNVIVASEYLKFSEDRINSDNELIDTILWKLGFPVDTFPDFNAELFAMQDKILLAIRQNDAGSHGEFDNDLRGLCANYFVKLEEVLRDSLSYVTWALTTDHFTSETPYGYRSSTDGLTALLSLNKASEGDPDDRKVVYSDQSSLYPLCRGYERLSVLLAGMVEDEEEHRRPSREFPSWVQPQSLQKFPFAHRVPFLDLAEDAREHILNRLRDASRLLVGVDVPDLRNSVAHPRSTKTDLDRLRSGLETIRDVITQLEGDGFCRITYTLSYLEGDSMSRRKLILSNKRGYKHALHTPSSHAWLRLPYSREPQYVMSSARLKDSTEVLRFMRLVESPFSEMYDGYAKRPAGSARNRHEEVELISEMKQG